jgi:hypothetical protein
MPCVIIFKIVGIVASSLILTPPTQVCLLFSARCNMCPHICFPNHIFQFPVYSFRDADKLPTCFKSFCRMYIAASLRLVNHPRSFYFFWQCCRIPVYSSARGVANRVQILETLVTCTRYPFESCYRVPPKPDSTRKEDSDCDGDRDPKP